MRISVVTPSLPERWAFRAECVQSVANQSLPPLEHLIGIDHARSGVSEVLSGLARGASGDYLALIADDDMMYPNHLSVLARLMQDEGADIAYSYCDVEGRDWNPNRPFDAALLKHGNYIPATSLIRRDLAADLGWWRPHSELGHDMEDWDFWNRALRVGAKFAYTETVTWRYRFHGKNLSIANK